MHPVFGINIEKRVSGMKIKWKELIISIAISLGVGLLSSFLTRNNMNVFTDIQKPPFTPPAWLFTVVWTILYVLMGISSYLIYIYESDNKKEALKVYAAQLAVNFSWSIIFFNYRMYLLAFAVLVLLWWLIVMMIQKFSAISQLAGKLQLPYLLWVTFAGYLNLAIYLLN